MKAFDHLLAGADPARLLPLTGLSLDPWQAQLLRSRARGVLLNCSRGAGKTRTCSLLALHTLLYKPGSLVLLLSRAQRQTEELLRYVKQGWRALEYPVATRYDSAEHLELVNDSRVLALPGREETVRAFQGVNLMLIDEAARVPDELYYSVRPMLNVSRGRLICLSTPFGPRGFFWKEWHDSQADWLRVRVPWHDCPRLTADMIAEERRTMGASWVAQEYECTFVAMEGLVYPDFARAVVQGDAPHQGRAVGGIDFGWQNPFAAVWGILDPSDILWLTGERYLSHIPLHEHAAFLKALGPMAWHADPSGATEIAELRAAGVDVVAGLNELRSGIAAVNARLLTGRLKIIAGRCPQLLREAQLYRYPSAAEGGEKPIDANNHALAALRYLIARIDAHFLARSRTQTAPAPTLPRIENAGWVPIH